MFVITADQVASRRHPDAVGDALEALVSGHGAAFPLAPERTAGDELQAMTPDATTALAVVLDLSRPAGSGRWSIGLGIGGVETPLPDSIRATTGPAFVAAREAVEAARRSPEPRFAIRGPGAGVLTASEVGALVGLLVLQRLRRTDGGWAVADAIRDGGTQRAAAEALGITPQAVSQRALAAGLRIEEEAIPALVRLLDALDSVPPATDVSGRIEP